MALEEIRVRSSEALLYRPFYLHDTFYTILCTSKKNKIGISDLFQLFLLLRKETEQTSMFRFFAVAISLLPCAKQYALLDAGHG